MSIELIIALVIAVIVGFFIMKITGFVFRIIVLALLIAFLYYLYASGAQEIILAPGAPEVDIINTMIVI